MFQLQLSKSNLIKSRHGEILNKCTGQDFKLYWEIWYYTFSFSFLTTISDLICRWNCSHTDHRSCKIYIRCTLIYDKIFHWQNDICLPYSSPHAFHSAFLPYKDKAIDFYMHDLLDKHYLHSQTSPDLRMPSTFISFLSPVSVMIDHSCSQPGLSLGPTPDNLCVLHGANDG